MPRRGRPRPRQDAHGRDLANTIGGTFVRLQFTPDLVPSDLVGTRIYRPSREAFDVELGPLFANFVLADEINRAPAKVQSALLEVMAERHVSIGGTTYSVPRPFLVLATQNPIESEGVYPLPEAQRDRFLMKIVVDYPTPLEEREIVRRMGASPPRAEQVIPADSLRGAATRRTGLRAQRRARLRGAARARDPSAGEYGLPHVAARMAYGASPRASLGLVAAGRALALLRGRNYVLPQDVVAIAPEVLRHRVVLSYEALAEGIDADRVVEEVLRTIPVPQIAPSQDRISQLPAEDTA